tara:strand:+ start:36 stop:275 length:240 start_codon:yes stop_codon:yes gene_type:complete
MKVFKLSHNFIGFIGKTEYNYTDAVTALHNEIKESQDWLQDYPKGKWMVELFDDETCEYKVLYTLTTAKIKKLQKDGLF